MAAQSAKPRVPGDNVRAFLKREEELRTCREDVKVTEIARGIAIFEEKGVRKASDSRRARQAKGATEELGHAPNLRPMYRDRGITLAEMRSELLSDAPFAGVASDGQPFGDGLPALASE